MSEGRGFPGAGRPGDQDEALVPAHDPLHDHRLTFRKVELGEVIADKIARVLTAITTCTRLSAER